MRKVFTLAIVVKDKKVLLGRKVRKLGAGFWNGFGGGLEAGESVEEAARRECCEEVGITPTTMRKHGVLIFRYPDKPLGATEHEVHIFAVTAFTGTPEATDEMLTPTWFSFDAIPYDSMWPDDRYWLPLLLAGKDFGGTFSFNKNKQLVSQTLEKYERSRTLT